MPIWGTFALLYLDHPIGVANKADWMNLCVIQDYFLCPGIPKKARRKE
jgi:hypothetical protein